jgi:hypothetical protein
MPPTEPFKRRVIARYAGGFPTFVETGTYQGDTVDAVRSMCAAVWSIELSPVLAERARERFAADPTVRILEGDSGVILPAKVLPNLDGPALFWLDGHWTEGADTARGPVDTPLVAELQAILRRRERDVILVDDVRMFGTGHYPSLDKVAEMVRSATPARELQVADDIARVVPAE